MKAKFTKTESITKALKALELGVYDGAHHKDWCIQQAIKHLRGWDDEELKNYLGRVSWEEGIPP